MTTRINAATVSAPGTGTVINKRLAIYASLLLAAYLPASFHANAQTSRTYLQPKYNSENYALTKDGTAGTVFNMPGANSSVHYMYHDAAGHAINSVYYDNGLGQDDKLADLNTLENGNQIITSASYDPATKEHFIRLITIAPDGQFLSAEDLKAKLNTPLDIYPKNSLVDGNTLYICGYFAAQGAGLIDYKNGGTSFVLSYDLATNTVMNARYFGFQSHHFWYNNPADPNVPNYYDMALRMKMIDIPNAGRYLVVTGGTNCFQNVLPLSTELDTCMGGTLVAMFDPATLVSNYHRAIQSRTLNITTDRIEYGIDLHYDPGTNKLYVLGNYAHALNGREGFATQPINPFIQALNIPYLTPAGTPSVADRTVFQTDGSWGLQLEADRNNPNTLTIAGLQRKPHGNCSYPNSLPPADGNISPFLLNVPIPGGSPFTTTVNDWTIMPGKIGTGMGINGYIAMAMGENTYAWPPRPMSQDAGVPYKIMAPINNKYLSTQFIAADGSRQLMDCQGVPSVICNPVVDSESAIVSASSTYFLQDDFNVSHSQVTLQDLPLNIREIACDVAQHKEAGPITDSDEPQLGSGGIYPNPATDFISLPYTRYDNSDRIQIVMTDMTGKIIHSLYEGMATSLPAHLKLPGVGNGIYFVTTSLNGQNTRKEKLTIIR